MKKFIVACAFALLGIGVYASTCVYHTSCGISGMTVGPDYFNDDWNEFSAYLMELNESLCGEKGPISYEIIP